MKLLSFIPSEKNIDFFKNNFSEYLEQFDFDGIETMGVNYYPLSEFENKRVRGVHLMYFPTWLEFWNEDRKALFEDFIDEDGITGYYGGLSREKMIEFYKREFENCKKLGVEYMVFHVSHVRPRDIFTYEFNYSDKDVLQAASQLINEVFVGEGPLLLFENLWWPGLNLNSVEDTDEFLNSINYKNKGLMLDIAHLICTDKTIKDEDHGTEFLMKKIGSLGEIKKHIKGVHLNFSAPGNYLKGDFYENLDRWEKSNRLERYHIEVDHVRRIDTHSVFRSDLITKILDEIPYQYLIFELGYSSIEELTEKIKSQMRYMKQMYL